MRFHFIPLDFDYIDKEDKTVVRIFGRTQDNKRCCVIDSCKPYFWLLPKSGINLQKYAEKVSQIKLEHAGRLAKVTDVKIKDKKFRGKDVKALQVFVNNPKDISTIKDIVKRMRETESKKEIDINFITRYIIEKDIKPLQLHLAEGKEIKDSKIDVDIVLEASNVKFLKDYNLEPKILAFDIETTEFEIGKSEILMLAVAGKDIQKIITWKHFANAPNNVEFVKDEVELIKKFKEIIKKEKPDCLVGYFSDGFDLPYLRARADKHKIKLNLGLDGSNVSFSRGVFTSGKITGITHVDIFRFVSNIISPILQSETLSLNEVAKEIVGEEKVKIDINKITKQLQKKGKIGKSELRKYCLYNLQDAVLTYKLTSNLWPNIAEITKLVNEPLFHTSRASYSQLVEYYIMHNLKRYNEICENRPVREYIEQRRKRGRYTGAFVFQPKPGLYEKIAVFDFRSLYPSIIVSFNISPPTIQKDAKNAYSVEAEFGRKKKKFYFSKKRGFIPELLSELLKKRKEVKTELRKKHSPVLEARDYGLKTLANATYGYFAFFGARYYSVECAASITSIGRQFLHKVIDETNKNGFSVIYADTDGIALILNKKTEKQALAFLNKLNKDLPEDMELELEDFYTRGIFVTKRTGEAGAKKKYALISKKGKIKIRGFETVRRDWCQLAKEVQDDILRSILKEGKIDKSLEYVKTIIKDINNKKIPIERLIIKTQLKKPIEEYVAIGPHVVIAKKMVKLGLPVGIGSLIEYVIAKGKKEKELIREKAKLPDEVKEGEYDTEYYLNHQIIPAIENIFAVFGIEKTELTETKQKKLHDFK